MMALAAYPLGIECRFVDTAEDSPGGQVGPIIVAALDDERALAALARQVDVITFDIENVSVDSLRELGRIVPVHPGPDIVEVAQDRLSEKRLFESMGIPVGRYAPADSAESLTTAAERVGFPLVLKARRLGYDGRGQRIVRHAAELNDAWRAIGEVPAIAEAFVEFEREVSLIGTRGSDGETVFYPLTENVHVDGILRTSISPYPDATLHAQASERMRALMQDFGYVGTLTIEFFEQDGQLLANEMAPRVHNSGHWTIEGAETSQFENHVRAVLGLPLGATATRGHTAMVNLLGEMPDRDSVLAIPGLHLHDYGKAPRPARKLGHCTLCDADRSRLLGRLDTLEAALASVPLAARK